MKRVELAAVVVLLCVSQVAYAQMPTQKMAIPAFFPLNKKSDGNRYDWLRILEAARTPIPPEPGTVKIVVADPSTLGTGFPSSDPCTASPQAMFNCLRQQGVLVLGYVSTKCSQRDNACTSSTLPPGWQQQSRVLRGGDDPNLGSVDAWYAAYGGSIDGIFLDEGPSLEAGDCGCRAGQQEYLKQYYGAYGSGLYQEIRNAHAGPCGGRACVMVNASQFPNDWVMLTANYATLWERPLYDNDNNGYQSYVTGKFCPCSGPGCGCQTTQSPNNWYSQRADKSLHLIHSTGPLNEWQVNDVVCRSANLGGPMLYLAEGTSNAYDRLPAYFEQLAQAMQGCPNVGYCGSGQFDACGNDCGVGSWCPAPEQCVMDPYGDMRCKFW